MAVKWFSLNPCKAKCIFVIIRTNQIIRERLPSSLPSKPLSIRYWGLIVRFFKNTWVLNWNPLITNLLGSYCMSEKDFLHNYNHKIDVVILNEEQKLELRLKSFRIIFPQRWLAVWTAWWSKCRLIINIHNL